MGSIRFHDLPHLVGQLVVHVPRRGQAKRIGDSPVEGGCLQESREDTAVDNASTPRRKRSLAYGGDTQKRAGDNGYWHFGPRQFRWRRKRRTAAHIIPAGERGWSKSHVGVGKRTLSHHTKTNARGRGRT
jgi:hypothetical protein